MLYSHWFVSRQKRQLTTLLPAVVAFSDCCVGKKWRGNTELQLAFEDELGMRNITSHGNLRARRSGSGGGGIRTLFKQMKDLGLVFTEEENGLCRLTLISEALIKGDVSFVDAMRLQLQKYQYPSATSWSGSGSISHNFRVHPFQFMFRLLRDPRLHNELTMEEMQGIVIHYANSDSARCFEAVVEKILQYRNEAHCAGYVEDTEQKKYSNIANTFFNYINLTQYVDRGNACISVRAGKETAVDEFIQDDPKFINNPDIQENYLRAYGRGYVAKDLRNFDREDIQSKRELEEARIRKEYVLLALHTPITGITPDVVNHIVQKTGIDEGIVEKFLLKNYPKGNIDDFFISYRELAHMGTAGATEFETATCEMFKKIFKMNAKHVGPIGNTPDVFVESEEYGYCGIIDNKAYKNGYSVSGDHKRIMEDVYIPDYKKYGGSTYPLAFFAYIAGSFGKNINGQINSIVSETGVPGSAMPVDIFISFAQNYAEEKYDHGDIRSIFSVNREVKLADLNQYSYKNESYAKAAEECAKYDA